MTLSWWLPSAAVGALAATALFMSVVLGPHSTDVGTARWWLLTVALHLPYLVIVGFLMFGVVERIGYLWRGRSPARAGRLPDTYPRVDVQLPMFNEHAVAERIITAAAALTWPCDRLTNQVLDDSTDPDTRALVDRVCARVRAQRDVDIQVLRRTDRAGYKAGALEEARHRTDAEFIAIFDADFVRSPIFCSTLCRIFSPPTDCPSRISSWCRRSGGISMRGSRV